MFRAELKKKLEAIFGLGKTTFDSPGEGFEQDVLFIAVDKSTSNTGQGKATARVEGTLRVFSRQDALPFGFFNKKIQQAPLELTKDLFFLDIDTDVANSPARTIDIAERNTRFIYLYKAQYDPNQGELTSLELTEEGV